jgi:hypothetical protein
MNIHAQIIAHGVTDERGQAKFVLLPGVYIIEGEKERISLLCGDRLAAEARCLVGDPEMAGRRYGSGIA